MVSHRDGTKYGSVSCMYIFALTINPLSLSLPSHFRNDVSYSFMYENQSIVLIQVDNPWYKGESVHYVVLTIYLIQTQMRGWGAKKETHQSINEHKQAQVK